MKTQHHIRNSLLRALPFTLAAVLLVGSSKQSSDLKLGFAGTLSGSASFVGVEVKRGAEMAIDEINAQGGVRGHKLALVARDDQHEPKNTVVLYRELVEREKVVAMPPARI